MTVLTCAHCGAIVYEVHDKCPYCNGVLGETPISDPRIRLLCDLLEKAHVEQEAGDIGAAIRTANEALLLRQDCSSTHALLGQLYEQSGDHASARDHFGQALAVDPACPCSEEPLSLPAPTPTPAAHGSWMTLVLIGCVIFSGLAALFTIWPFERSERSGIVNIVTQPDRSVTAKPRWDFRVPSPLHMIMPTPTPSAPPPTPMADPSGGVLVSENQSTEPTAAPPVPAPAPAPTQLVLGPSASIRAPALPIEPTVEDAERASFSGKFERAIAIYEAIIRTQDKPAPGLHQQLAWCYQQLGNSAKAEEHLNQAIQGYRKQLEAAAKNTAAQQGVKTCESALTALHDPRDAKPNP